MKHVVLIPGAGIRQSAWGEPLQQALGPEYAVVAPEMPNPDEPDYEEWKHRIEDVLSSRDGDFILVGHSFGGWVLLKYLAENEPRKRVVGLCTFAVPYFSGDDKEWHVAEYQTPQDFSALARIPRIVLSHSRDDENVPFAHLLEFARKLPQATVRTFDHRGHEFLNWSLAELIDDIRSMTS